MSKEFYEKHANKLDCSTCQDLVNCINRDEPYCLKGKLLFSKDKIADLEAKLAEVQECGLRASAKHNLEMQNVQICMKELEAELAEKDKEISNLKGLVNERDKQIKNLKTNKKRVIEHKNNVKISFCIEQLEKVKELAYKDFELDKGNISLARVLEEIDNQIKQLKEMK